MAEHKQSFPVDLPFEKVWHGLNKPLSDRAAKKVLKHLTVDYENLSADGLLSTGSRATYRPSPRARLIAKSMLETDLPASFSLIVEANSEEDFLRIDRLDCSLASGYAQYRLEENEGGSLLVVHGVFESVLLGGHFDSDAVKHGILKPVGKLLDHIHRSAS